MNIEYTVEKIESFEPGELSDRLAQYKKWLRNGDYVESELEELQTAIQILEDLKERYTESDIKDMTDPMTEDEAKDMSVELLQEILDLRGDVDFYMLNQYLGLIRTAFGIGKTE